MRSRRLAPAALALFVLPGAANGQCDPLEVQKLLASDGAAEDAFGRPIAVWGDVLITGAIGDDDAGPFTGAAYVFRRVGDVWSEEQKLTAGDGAADDYFGQFVAIRDDLAVVGAGAADIGGKDSGAAYVFRFDGESWVEEQKLLPSGGIARAVAIAGPEVVLIADPGDDDNGQSAGAAYVFRFDGMTWTEDQKIKPSDGRALQGFGVSIGVGGPPDDDAIIVGASNDTDNGLGAGAAYIFRLQDESWVEEQKLLASDGGDFDKFGTDVAIRADTALVGAIAHNDYAGAAYVFRRDGDAWVEEQELTASDADDSGRFGGAVDLGTSPAGEIALVGEPWDLFQTGAAYLFRRQDGAWNEEAKLTASDGGQGEFFGDFLSLGSDQAVVGAWGHDAAGPLAGAAYVFDLGCACPADADGDGNLNVLDFVAFQLLWQDQDAAADCDANAAFNVLDFVCYQQLFQAGCD